MSNLERTSPELPPEDAHSPTPAWDVLDPREVPLGGPRSLTVRRTLPHKSRRMIGPWCFLDHYGPTSGADSLMRVPPHPHTGLQTVSWLLAGEILHTDSVGSRQIIKPGQLNLMTAGRGISHAEDSLGDAGELHGIQLWVALPEDSRHQPPHFEHHHDLPAFVDAGIHITLIMGELHGMRSPALTYSPMVSAEIRLAAGTRLLLDLNSEFEHGLLAVEGEVSADDNDLPLHALIDLGKQRDALELHAQTDAVLLLVGGAPFDEEIVMWWNFVGRTHEEIAQARDAWQESDFFGAVEYDGNRLEAPTLPLTRLKARPSKR
jgi:quercetin 2,3-dioxygenase